MGPAIQPPLRDGYSPPMGICIYPPTRKVKARVPFSFLSFLLGTERKVKSSHHHSSPFHPVDQTSIRWIDGQMHRRLAGDPMRRIELEDPSSLQQLPADRGKMRQFIEIGKRPAANPLEISHFDFGFERLPRVCIGSCGACIRSHCAYHILSTRSEHEHERPSGS